MLYWIIILPIEALVGWIFAFVLNNIPAVGVIGAVVGVSIAINFLALPLYNIADSLQEKERKITKSLESRVKRIKKAFKGDEQFMMLQTYYKQNNYHPLYVLRSSLSILIEIPFFIAAYHFLSNNETLRGASWWIFDNLGAPDTLLTIGGVTIHVLPILMTLINFVSGAIYCKDAPSREKIQLYGIAALFLILLYNSPSGLVIYWILNNLFSLLKNIVMKSKNPGFVTQVACSICLVPFTLYFLIHGGMGFWTMVFFIVLTLCVIFLPFLKGPFNLFMNKIGYDKLSEEDAKIRVKKQFPMFLFSCLGLALLAGFVLPSSTIASSPIEFSYLGTTGCPTAYVWSSLYFFLGMFVFWPVVIYKMFNVNVKRWLCPSFFMLFIISLLNAFVFKSNYGEINAVFEMRDYSTLMNTGRFLAIFPFVVFVLIFVLFRFIRYKKAEHIVTGVLASICVAACVFSFYQMNKIKSVFNELEANKASNPVIASEDENIVKPVYHLSKTGKNVFVLFLDRGMGMITSDIFNDHPDIKKQFDGFVDYRNAVSFSDYTVSGAPPMMGGYEYSQHNINSRNKELLKDKHNESILVMPKLFADAGFASTVSDPPWCNYHWSGDLSIFDAYPEINVLEVEGKYKHKFLHEKNIKISDAQDEICKAGAVTFSMIQIVFPVFRRLFYFNNLDDSFYSQLSSLYYMNQLTDFTSEKSTFHFVENETTHEVYISLNDDYETPAEFQIKDFTVQTFHANIAALKQIGKWLDYLRANDCYDNTRIIIVSDHGRGIKYPACNEHVSWYQVLLLYKDFNSNEPLKEDYSFMTNADTIFLAKDGIEEVSDVNPFTGKKFETDKENGIDIYHCNVWNAENLRSAYTLELDDEKGWHVSSDIRYDKNWIPMKEYKKK